MEATIQKVTKTNYEEILKLEVAGSQKGFIESPLECLEDAVKWKEYQPVGLYIDETPVGFAMYGFFEGEGRQGRLWIDRLLIDEKYQGKGYGTLFMEALMERAIEEYGEQPLYLSVYRENEGAVHLYEKLGFHFIDERDINGELIMCRP